MHSGSARPGGLRLLVTVTFNANQLRAHLLPLISLDEVESITLVADVAPPALPKVRAVVPPSSTRRLLGRAAAKRVLLRRLVQLERFDWVMGFHFVPHGLNAVGVARGAGTRSMYHMIGGEQEWSGGGRRLGGSVLGRLPRARAVMERCLVVQIRQATVVATMGPRMRERMIERGFHPDSVAVIPPATDLGRFRESSAPKVYDVACIAALLEVKRIHLLVDALVHVRRDRPEFRAVVAGDGPLRAELEARARRQGVAEMISFLGHVHDVERVYGQSRSYAVMSSSEGMPIAMLDAMAAGLPIVTPDVGEIGTLVVDGRNGLVYPGGDAAELAGRLLELSSDDAMRGALGRAARADVAATHSVEAISAVYRQHLAPEGRAS